jgi:NAD(P)-dependent dehydrogenase (short-subunit alcohol dehydrogenase family)
MKPPSTALRPVALVTGGSQGIGAAIALQLARDGLDVAITALQDDGGGTCAQIQACGVRALCVRGDLADVHDHARVLDAVCDWGGVPSCLVNNAGMGSPRRGDLLDIRAEDFDRVMATNLRGSFFFTQAVARRMLAAPSEAARSIVTVSSVSGQMASVERGDYCLSKAGLAMLTRLFALRLAGQGIAVFEVRPGIIRTAMTAGVADRYDALIAEGLVPLRRWGQPQDVARAVAALAGGRFAFATGSVVHADGGLSIARL